MALSADRFLDMSREGVSFDVPVHAADTYYKGATCRYNGGRASLTGGASGPFAGIVEKQVVATAQGDIVRLRVPRLVTLPHASAALANRGQRCHAVTDDETIGFAAVGAAQVNNTTPIGVVRDVDVGASVTVEVGVHTEAN